MLVEQSKKEKKFIIIVGGKMSNANEEEKPLNKKRNHQYTRSHFGFLEELKKIDAHEKYVEEKLDSQEYREDCISKSILEKEYEEDFLIEGEMRNEYHWKNDLGFRNLYTKFGQKTIGGDGTQSINNK
jgi:hypothetical protein